MTRRPIPLNRLRHFIAGGVLSLAIVLGTAVLSARPEWQSLQEGHAVLRLSFTHPGVRNCRDRTESELAVLPKNMRNAQNCDRRRAPVQVKLEIDGRTVLDRELSPSGLAGSGPSRVYERINLPAGRHNVAVRLRDDPSIETYKYRAEFDIVADPGESIAIDFDAARGGFFLY